MNLVNKLKKNAFAVIIIITYISLMIFNRNLGFSAINNSKYYIIEMLTIMPVIFVLTALLDSWISRETISKYLGKDSRLKGIILSFVLGAVSAGPIYAAFPVCTMLHKKGTSIRNIVIILSSWAVIKLPMLINEIKYLGFDYMISRWILTVIAILIFSWISSLIVSDKDIPDEEEIKGLTIDQDACIGCTLCSKTYPEVFIMKNNKATITTLSFEFDQDKISKSISECPANAISNN